MTALPSRCAARASTFKPKIMLGMVMLSIVLLAVCKWMIFVNFQQIEQLNARQLKLEAISNGLLYHQEAMSSAAQMYTLTTLPRWLSQYKSSKQQLGQDLIDLRLEATEAFRPLNNELEGASNKLLAIEAVSFSLIKEGTHMQGHDLLSGPDYLTAKEVFADKLIELKQDIDDRNRTQEARLRDQLAWRLALLGAVLLGLLVMWAACMRLMLQWERKTQDADALANSAETKLSLQSRVLDNILDNLPVGLFAKDVQNNYLYSICNKKAEELFEISADKLLGTTDFEHFPVQEASFFRQTDEKVVREGRVIDVEMEDVTSPRGTWLAHTIKVPIYDDSGAPSLLVGIFEDITIKKHQADIRLQAQAEELELKNSQLESAYQRAEAADKAKAEFLTTMSAELGAPLAAIAAAADHLLRAELNGRAGGHVRTIRKCAGLLLFTLNDMADLSEREAIAVPTDGAPVAAMGALADINADKRARLEASFRDSAKACLSELEQAALFADTVRFMRAAHQLKGAAATFGYTRLQEMADRAEHAMEGDREELVAEIRGEFLRGVEKDGGIE